jgi:hypothetical protein
MYLYQHVNWVSAQSLLTFCFVFFYRDVHLPAVKFIQGLDKKLSTGRLYKYIMLLFKGNVSQIRLSSESQHWIDLAKCFTRSVQSAIAYRE